LVSYSWCYSVILLQSDSSFNSFIEQGKSRYSHCCRFCWEIERGKVSKCVLVRTEHLRTYRSVPVRTGTRVCAASYCIHHTVVFCSTYGRRLNLHSHSFSELYVRTYSTMSVCPNSKLNRLVVESIPSAVSGMWTQELTAGKNMKLISTMTKDLLVTS